MSTKASRSTPYARSPEDQRLEVEFQDLPWPSLIPALSSERIDILVTGLNVTEERDEVIDFTIPWWENDDEVPVAEDSDKNVVTALCCGATVGAQGGSTQYGWIEEHLVDDEAVGLELAGYEDYVTAVEDMGVGRLDAVVVSTDTAEDFIAKGRAVKIVGTIKKGQPQALAVAQGDPHELLPVLNQGIMNIAPLAGRRSCTPTRRTRPSARSRRRCPRTSRPTRAPSRPRLGPVGK